MTHDEKIDAAIMSIRQTLSPKYVQADIVATEVERLRGELVTEREAHDATTLGCAKAEAESERLREWQAKALALLTTATTEMPESEVVDVFRAFIDAPGTPHWIREQREEIADLKAKLAQVKAALRKMVDNTGCADPDCCDLAIKQDDARREALGLLGGES